MADQDELSGANTMPILPPEVWMQVFEEIYPDEGDLHQQRLWRRYEAIKTFHNIQLVCKQWAVSSIHSHVYRTEAQRKSGPGGTAHV